MALQSARIIFNDSQTQCNKDLTDYLKRNTEVAIRRGGLAFRFEIATPNDLIELRRMKVKKLPAMIINNMPYVGNQAIIAELQRCVKNSKRSVPVKTEEEIVREYHMHALGNITKDAEGRLKVHDEQERDETENLMSAFNREITRRGASAGHVPENDDEDPEYNQRMHRPQPSRPARNTQQDMDDEEPQQPQRRNPQDRGNAFTTPQQRPDNVVNPAMEDAFNSLKNISRNATADDARDDEMMAALLNRMGGGD